MPGRWFWLCVLLVLALLYVSDQANARATHNYGDCAWSEQGETLVFPGVTYRCTCVRMMGPQGKHDVWCSWRALNAALKKHAKRHVLFHAPLPGVVG